MEIIIQELNGFLDWKVKTRNLKEKISDLEFRELEVKMVYYSIMQNACTQFGGFVAVTSIMPSLFLEFKYSFVLGMILAFILYIICPLYFGSRKMGTLKSSTRLVIVERKRIYKSCISLMIEYTSKCDVSAPFKDSQALLLKELGDIEMEKIKDFKKEDADLVYQTKYYRKFLFLIGIVGIIYAVGFMSAVNFFFQDSPRVSRGVPIKAK